MPDTLAPSVSDVVELTRALVRCESVTPAEGGALQLLERTLGTLGFRCERMDFTQAGTDDVANLYARIGQAPNEGGKHFCFAGHSDVVPVGDLSSWTIGPFSAELSAGYLFGRGAADMKGAIAAFTEASARFLAKRGRDFGGAISLLITGDEEGPAVNGTVKMLKRLAERGETIDACIVGEPTSSQALRRHDEDRPARQHDRRLVVRGIQGHVAYPERLDNAIHRLSAIIEALVREPIDKGSTHFQPTSLQFTTVDVGNKATNIAPGVAKARFNTRFNDLWTSRTLLAHLQERIERTKAAPRRQRHDRVQGRGLGRVLLHATRPALGAGGRRGARRGGRGVRAVDHRRHLRRTLHPFLLPGAGVRPGRRDHAQGRREECRRRPQGARARLRNGARPLFRCLSTDAEQR